MSQPLRPARARRTALIVAGALGLVSLGLVSLCLRTVNFSPHVGPQFFFSSEDPALQVQLRIAEQFQEPTQVILSAEGPFTSPRYVDWVAALTAELAEVPGVMRVLSLTRGPRGLDDAFESPLWQRVLISKDRRASHLIVFVPELSPPELIRRLEEVAARYHGEGFRLSLSGVPYIVEMMRRHLARDLRVFTVATIVVFGLLVLAIVRSWALVLGMLAVCASAGSVTFLLIDALQIRVGILTANLATIVFTMVLSHIVFMTFNWRRLSQRHGHAPAAAAWAAVRTTIGPSCWSMFTTLLGFGSLLFVQAEPLRRLGFGGTVATVSAFLMPYGMFPWVLLVSRAAPASARGQGRQRCWTQRLLSPRPMAVRAFLAGCLIVSAGIGWLRKDPSLLSYFANGSAIREGLEYIDTNLGSSPLSIVVRDLRGGAFTSTQQYQRLWELPQALEQDPDVGSVVSLPVIMAEARRVPLGGVVVAVGLAARDHGGGRAYEVGKFFITADRMSGRFLLLMRERERRGVRMATVDRLTGIVRAHGFEPYLIGGMYIFQGKLSQLVVSSLLSGLALLCVVFLGIVYGLVRSWRVALAVIGSVALIPLWMLGVIGLLRVPFDVICAPSANLAVGMGIDAMLHLLAAARRAAPGRRLGWPAWIRARREQWRPILLATVVVCAGFAVFGLSAFPSTQRFGLMIVLGTAIVPLAALWVLPAWATGALWRRNMVSDTFPSRKGV